MPTVQVDAEALREFLAMDREQAFRAHCKYDATLRHHVMTDEMWQRGDPRGYELHHKLAAALAG